MYNICLFETVNGITLRMMTISRVDFFIEETGEIFIKEQHGSEYFATLFTPTEIVIENRLGTKMLFEVATEGWKSELVKFLMNED
jgi:hypothetical protein